MLQEGHRRGDQQAMRLRWLGTLDSWWHCYWRLRQHGFRVSVYWRKRTTVRKFLIYVYGEVESVNEYRRFDHSHKGYGSPHVRPDVSRISLKT